MFASLFDASDGDRRKGEGEKREGKKAVQPLLWSMVFVSIHGIDWGLIGFN
jgi:hypothetical protein